MRTWAAAEGREGSRAPWQNRGPLRPHPPQGLPRQFAAPLPQSNCVRPPHHRAPRAGAWRQRGFRHHVTAPVHAHFGSTARYTSEVRPSALQASHRGQTHHHQRREYRRGVEPVGLRLRVRQQGQCRPQIPRG
ncbi:hypothetical protein I4F81_006071 [Pyropia yezoensis]|uniref:Uncharacterized protein n=1 Tax=Pyropia yezoensis TaxID=2788 RepID=A0ACC3C0P0_PYRYE|nr:hypothetical protein I4F81_006071 [Neopyropia yezoensis]